MTEPFASPRRVKLRRAHPGCAEQHWGWLLMSLVLDRLERNSTSNFMVKFFVRVRNSATVKSSLAPSAPPTRLAHR